MKNKIKPDQLDWATGKIKGFHGKQLIDTENGGIKLIKICPQSYYPEHMHPDKTEYAYVLEGNPVFEIDNISYTSEPGDFFIFPSKMQHAITNKTSTECLLLVGAIKT